MNFYLPRVQYKSGYGIVPKYDVLMLLLPVNLLIHNV